MTDALPPIRERTDDKRPITYESWNLKKFWQAAYRALDERQWLVLTERYIQERTPAQIGEDLDLSERHVRRLIDEAMNATLREYQR